MADLEIVEVAPEKPKWPLRLLLVLLIVIIVIEAYWLGSNHGLGTAGSGQRQKAELIAAQDYLMDAVEALKNRNQELSDKIVVLEQQVAIDNETKLELKRLVSDQQGKEQKLLEQISLYQGIVATEGNKSGVRIQEVSVKRLAENDYRFNLAVMQLGKHNRDAKIYVNLKMIGKMKGQAAMMSGSGSGFDQVNGGKSIRFRYLWEWNGIAKLPGEFIPLELQLEIKNAKKKVLLSEIFPWQDVLK